MFITTRAARAASPGSFLSRLVLSFWLAVPLAVLANSTGTAASNAPTVMVVVGAEGEEEFGEYFTDWAARWEPLCQKAGAKLLTFGLKTNSTATDLELFERALHDEPKEGLHELWLVLIGHGTFDGKEAKFNLRGLDLSASELAGWMQPFRRPLAIINTSSSSGPFLNKVAGEGRVVISATRSGHEQNFARFGRYFSEAIADAQADLDKDGQTSLLEAFLTGSYRVAEFYKTEGRLATEHALLDDNGDGLGTPPDWFRGIRAVKKAKDGAALDGLRAHQFHLVRSEAEQKMPAELRAKRDELDLGVAKLRDLKKDLPEEEYYRRLEPLLLEIARLYERSEGGQSQ
jgi:hypothetical protein